MLLLLPLRPAGLDELIDQKNDQLLAQQHQAPGTLQEQHHLAQPGQVEHIHAQNILPGGLVEIQIGGALRVGAVDGLAQLLVPFGMGKAVGLDDLLAEPVGPEGDDLLRRKLQRSIRRKLPHQYQRHGRHVGGHTVGKDGVKPVGLVPLNRLWPERISRQIQPHRAQQQAEQNILDEPQALHTGFLLSVLLKKAL